MEPTRGDYDTASVDGMDTLRERMAEANSVRDWSFILGDYISWGNSKIDKSVAIFNMNSATDCPNADSGVDNQSDTGACQVPWDDCYAHKAENVYPQTLEYRRRQEYLWDSLDPQTFADAFKALVSRKRNAVSAIRFSEAGDFRHRGDIVRVNQIAEALADTGIQVYTYSASHKLPWNRYATSDNFTVNQSNDMADYGDRLFTALPEGADLPDGMVWCPHDRDKRVNDKTSEEAVKCGECRLCINSEGPDVAIELH